MKLVRVNETTREGYKVTRITHSQSIKQSLNYQSMDCTCGIEIEVNSSDPKAISRAYAAAIQFVERELTVKAVEQKGVLKKLG